jgi:hypothetical protein
MSEGEEKHRPLPRKNNQMIKESHRFKSSAKKSLKRAPFKNVS